MKMRSLIVMSVCMVCALHALPVESLPFPQLTEAEFNARARSLDVGFDNEVYMISGYSQVRRQGGRSYQEPIKFPTLTVKSPNQLPVDSKNKVRVSLANPVYKEELNSIVQQINEINIEEAERIDQEKAALQEEDNLEPQLAAEMTIEDLENEIEQTTRLELESLINELEIVEVTTNRITGLTEDTEYENEEKLETTTKNEQQNNEENLPTTQTLEILEVTNVNKIEIPSVQETEENIQPSQSLDSIDYNIQLGDIDYSNSQSEDTTDLIDQSEDSSDSTLIGEIITGGEDYIVEVEGSGLEPSLMEEMSLDIELGDEVSLSEEVQVVPLQTEQLLIEEVTTERLPTLQIEEV